MFKKSPLRGTNPYYHHSRKLLRRTAALPLMGALTTSCITTLLIAYYLLYNARLFENFIEANQPHNIRCLFIYDYRRFYESLYNWNATNIEVQHMLTHIKIIDKKFNVEKLKKSVIPVDVGDKLGLNGISKNTSDKCEEMDADDSNESNSVVINSNEILICCVNNTEEMTYIQFAVFSEGYDSPYINHDYYCMETVTGLDYIEVCGLDYVVVSTFGEYIYLYDCFMYNSFSPQILLHASSQVVSLFVADNTVLYTLHKDKSLRKWELGEESRAFQVVYQFSKRPLGFRMVADKIVAAYKDRIKCYGFFEREFNDGILDYELKCDHAYVVTNTGLVTVFDYSNRVLDTFHVCIEGVSIFRYTSSYYITAGFDAISIFDNKRTLLKTFNRGKNIFCAEFLNERQLLIGGESGPKLLEIS